MPENYLTSVSNFVQKFIYVRGKPFNFNGWEFTRAMYDTGSRYRIFKCARQVSKSTTTGNSILSYSVLIPGFHSLYVTPHPDQISTFSTDRLSVPITESPILSKMISRKLSNNKTEKVFINQSIIRLRTAFLNADKARGIASRMVAVDELQDLMNGTDSIPVLLECAATYPEERVIIFSGTPKTFDNALEYYWAKESSMNEWLTRCPNCGQWNGTKIENIGEHGYSCFKCSRILDVRSGMWVAGKKNALYDGYHVNQLLVPWTYRGQSWEVLKAKQRVYSESKFRNEVLGESFDQGIKPVTREEILACCQPFSMLPTPTPQMAGQLTVAGIDWGVGETAFTVLIILLLHGTKYRVMYAKRYVGIEAEQTKMLKHILSMLHLYNTNLVGADWGFGYFQNNWLREQFPGGHSKIVDVFYSDAVRKKFSWDKQAKRVTANRTMVLADTFQLIKRREFEFPNESQWMDPFGDDILNEFIEENSKTNKLIYTHTPGRPDDSLQALTYASIAAQFLRPREDLTPKGLYSLDDNIPADNDYN